MAPAVGPVWVLHEPSMSRRAHPERRCPGCRLHLALCLCGDVAPIDTVHRLCLVIHAAEANKTTNSGLLAARSLRHCDVKTIGHTRPEQDDDVAGALGLAVTTRCVLLFPADDARPLADVVAEASGPITLVVPDGTWAQTQKMRRRVPGLQALPCVSLPAGPPTAYHLRAEPKEGGLSTLEAIARAFCVLEGPQAGPVVEEGLLSIFARFVERTLWMRGQLADRDLVYGLPDAARRVSPRGGVAAPGSSVG